MCNCEAKNTRLNTLFTVMDGLMSEYEREIRQKYEDDKALEHLNDQMEDIENNTKLIVANEKDDIGMNKFSNDEARKSAVYAILRDHKGYQALREEKIRLLLELEPRKIRLDVLVRRMRQQEFNKELESMRKD